MFETPVVPLEDLTHILDGSIVVTAHSFLIRPLANDLLPSFFFTPFELEFDHSPPHHSATMPLTTSSFSQNSSISCSQTARHF